MSFIAEVPITNRSGSEMYHRTATRTIATGAAAVLPGAFTMTAPALGADEALMCNGKTATIAGSDAWETLVGTPGDDVILGLGGDDLLYREGGNDTLCGGDGDDDVRGREGDDWLDSGAGTDWLLGQAGPTP